MTRIRINWIRGLAGGLALMAALACSIMPGGLIPKVAGRCGRVLCSCEPEPNYQNCKLCHSTATQHAHFKFNLVLSTTTISNADTPGIAFQLVLTGMIAPYKALIPNIVESHLSVSPDSTAFALSAVASDITTPPPRA